MPDFTRKLTILSCLLFTGFCFWKAASGLVGGTDLSVVSTAEAAMNPAVSYNVLNIYVEGEETPIDVTDAGLLVHNINPCNLITKMTGLDEHVFDFNDAPRSATPFNDGHMLQLTRKFSRMSQGGAENATRDQRYLAAKHSQGFISDDQFRLIISISGMKFIKMETILTICFTGSWEVRFHMEVPTYMTPLHGSIRFCILNSTITSIRFRRRSMGRYSHLEKCSIVQVHSGTGA